MKAVGLFAALLIVVTLGLGVAFALAFSSTAERHAIEASAVVAVVVQLFAFVIARAMLRTGLLTGWIIGVALRFATVVGYAFVSVKLLGLPAAAALLSLATFLFITTLFEPKLLTV